MAHGLRVAVLRAAWLCVPLLAAGCAVATAPNRDAQCDRGCMSGVLDMYLHGIFLHDPTKAGLAADYRGTENTRVVAPGAGLWQSAIGPGAVQRTYIDTQSHQAAWFAIVREAGQTDIVSLRLKVAQGRVAEAEWTIARNGNGLFNLDSLAANPPPDAILPPDQRTDRATMVAISDGYFSAVQNHVEANLPHDPACDRFENGERVTHRTAPLPPPPGVRPPPAGLAAAPGAAQEMLMQDCVGGFGRTRRTIASADFRRYPVVDEAKGVVLAQTMFHRPPGAPMLRNLLNEYFWFRAGKLVTIYAAMHYLPADAPDTTGWN